jgi:chemotaxis protein histidine kinase CheA
LSLIGTEKIDEILAGVVESMPSLAKELGKEPPQITIDDHGIVVRNQISGLLKNLFVHLFRNSMDHGLETAEVRQAAGKAAAGHIYLSLAMEAGQFKLKLRDDGRGLNIARIRQKAIEENLLTDGAGASPETVAQMIFTSGFSTADKVTEVSGRGVGMDAVKGFLQREGGDARIHFLDSNAGADFRPFEIIISLPDKFAVQVQM